MKHSNTAQASLLLALIAGIAVTNATRERITVKNHGIKFKVDWWDDGRTDPYRVSFTKQDVSSEYFFDAAGRLKSLNVDDAVYQFTMAIEADGDTAGVQSLSAPADRMLHSMEDEPELNEMEFDHHRRRLYDCSDCEETWDTMCDIGLEDVCYWVGKATNLFTSDAQTSIKRMCTKFAKECLKSAETTCEGMCTEVPSPEITPAPTPAPEVTPAPTPAPQNESTDACDPNPCENGGDCAVDLAGGHVCSCASDYGGMACQTDTSSLASFYIEIDYIGTWTDARKAVFQSAADKWSEVITHVPCGGSADNPAGSLLISSTLETIDGVGNVLGSAGPSYVWTACPTISFIGAMRFDIDDIATMEEDGTFEGVILHEMGHVIGVGTLWGAGFGDCTTCRVDSNPAWTCPAALSAYADIGGTGSDIVELDGSSGTSCGHLDEAIFDDELMTGWVDTVMYLSKMTASILDDLDYIVDPSAVDTYHLPSERDTVAMSESPSPSIPIVDIAVETIIFAVDTDGNVVEEKEGVLMEF